MPCRLRLAGLLHLLLRRLRLLDWRLMLRVIAFNAEERRRRGERGQVAYEKGKAQERRWIDRVELPVDTPATAVYRTTRDDRRILSSHHGEPVADEVGPVVSLARITLVSTHSVGSQVRFENRDGRRRRDGRTPDARREGHARRGGDRHRLSGIDEVMGCAATGFSCHTMMLKRSPHGHRCLYLLLSMS